MGSEREQTSRLQETSLTCWSCGLVSDGKPADMSVQSVPKMRHAFLHRFLQSCKTGKKPDIGTAT